MLDLCTLGTGGTIPLATRALSSLYVRVGSEAMLIDCGEATQIQIQKLGWGFKCISTLLLTHFHADHVSGLPGLLLSIAKSHRTEPLHIWGPPGLTVVVTCLRVIAPQLTFTVVLHELPEERQQFSALGMDITAFPLNHGIPCFGYSLRLGRQRAFLPERAEALGVPKRSWGLLQHGESVTVDGRTVAPEEVLGPARRGLHLLYATDTRPVPAIAEEGRGADLMILEGMYPNEEKMDKALKNRHMIFAESAAIARDAGAGRLLLTHFSTSLEEPEAFLPVARAIFPETDCAADGMVLTLRYPAE